MKRETLVFHGCCGCDVEYHSAFCPLQGKPKKNESLWGVACGVFRMLRKNYGCVRVDFTQPFSLKVSSTSLFSSWHSCGGFDRPAELLKSFQFAKVLSVRPLQEYLDTQRSRHLPASLTLEQVLIPTIIAARYTLQPPLIPVKSSNTLDRIDIFHNLKHRI